MGRRAAFGVAAVGLYVAVALVSAVLDIVPVRPLYDGLAPPVPYRFVNPPPDLTDSNEPPLREVGSLELGPEGSSARTVSTPDGQMLLVFAGGAVLARDDESEVKVTITPRDPAPLPPAPPGLRIDGNAYVVAAAYAGSGEAIELREPVTVVMRYPVHATVMLQQRRGGWRSLRTQSAQASLQLFAETSELGSFVAAGPPAASRVWIAYLAAGAGVLAGAAGYLTGRRRGSRRRKRSRRPRTRRPR
jgi:hypothetical protein